MSFAICPGSAGAFGLRTVRVEALHRLHEPCLARTQVRDVLARDDVLLLEQVDALVAQALDVGHSEVRCEQRAVALGRRRLGFVRGLLCCDLFQRFAPGISRTTRPVSSITSTSAPMHSGGMFWPKKLWPLALLQR